MPINCKSTREAPRPCLMYLPSHIWNPLKNCGTFPNNIINLAMWCLFTFSRVYKVCYFLCICIVMSMSPLCVCLYLYWALHHENITWNTHTRGTKCQCTLQPNMPDEQQSFRVNTMYSRSIWSLLGIFDEHRLLYRN